MIDDGLRTLFLAEATITAVVGVTGVYVGWVPEGIQSPYVLLTLLDDDPLGTLDGTSGTRQAEFDVDCYGNTGPQAANLAEIVSSFFKDFTGTAGSETVAAVVENDRQPEVIPPQSGTEQPEFIMSLDYTIHH